MPERAKRGKYKINIIRYFALKFYSPKNLMSGGKIGISLV
nr:MAG TPA: hypothetical protein [Caudoviricetes sp.]